MSVHSFFFNDTATTEIYTLSLHDALPIYQHPRIAECAFGFALCGLERLLELGVLVDASHALAAAASTSTPSSSRSEEHTSELQSPDHLVCRLLLEKKNTTRR